MPRGKARRKGEPPSITNLIERNLWDALKRRLESGRDKESDLCNPQHLRSGLVEGAPPKVIAELIDLCPENASLRQKKNGWIPLHYACKHAASLETIEILLKVYPEGVRVMNDKQELAVDCLPNYRNAARVSYIANARSLLENPPLDQKGATIWEGVGGQRKKRQARALERKQMVREVAVYHVPIAGLPGFVGALHSVVKIIYSYRDGFYKRQDSVWVERVGDMATGNNVLFKEEPNTRGFELFRSAKGQQMKQNLSMFEVREKALDWGKIEYCVHENNCHILAMDLFNYCLSHKGLETKKISKDQLPNRFASFLVAKFLSPSIGSRMSGSGLCSSKNNHFILGSASCAAGTSSVAYQGKKSKAEK